MDMNIRVSAAIKHFWQTRSSQNEKQGLGSGKKDQGNRSSVTGGAQLDGFITLFRELLVESGLPDAVVKRTEVTLPGYFRPTKDWDLVIAVDGALFASIEFKSHIGPSFGNNFNNRVEEAIGSATDIWTAYREGMFSLTRRPWLGWFMLLEDVPACTTPSVRPYNEPFFPVRSEFKVKNDKGKSLPVSYAQRYAIFCRRLMEERVYDATCLLLSNAENGINGYYREVDVDLSFDNFATSLSAQAIALAKQRYNK